METAEVLSAGAGAILQRQGIAGFRVGGPEMD
jgi:hypothetical protein